MKLNFRKITAIGSSLLLTGMSIAAPVAAANYPSPFVVGGTANVAIVYGTGAGVSALDVVEAGNIQSNLQSKMGTGAGITATGTVGESKSLNSGSDLLYMLDDLAENVQTLTKDDLSTVLADGTFTDDDGTDTNYEQTITIGTSTTSRLAFGDSNNDYDDPQMMIELSKDPDTAPMYILTATFNKALNMTSDESEGEEITMFGKTYTIGTATDTNTLVLQGGSESTKINVGETSTLSLDDGVNYAVSLDGLSSDSTTQAGITVNGVYKSLIEGQNKAFIMSDGTEVSIYAKTVFRTGSDGTGYVEIELSGSGTGKLIFENGKTVKYGSDSTSIKGTMVQILPAPGGATAEYPGFGNITKFQINISAPSNDANDILVGSSFVDPVFGSLKLDFTSLMYGPIFEAEDDTGRASLSIVRGGDRELNVELIDENGDTAIVPFAYQGKLADDDGDTIFVLENSNITEDDYIILNSGDYEEFLEITDISLGAGATSSITYTDLLTGTSVEIKDKDFSAGYDHTINGQTYTITNTSATDGITITSSDYSTRKSIFPYIELVAGKDNRVAFVQNVSLGLRYGTVMSNATDTAVLTNTSAIFELPTGNIQFRMTNVTETAGTTLSWDIDEAGTFAVSNSTDLVAAGDVQAIVVGNVSYDFGVTSSVIGQDDAWMNITNVSLTTITGASAGPSLLYVEHEDKSATTSSIEPAVTLGTTTSATYDICDTPLFSFASGTEGWDDTKFTGYITSYGTYVVKDTTDTNQALTRLTYGASQMYADVYFAEIDAVLTAGVSGASTVTQIGDILVKDSEVSSVATKNLIVVGGSCINSAAASLVGGAYCGAAWTTATNVGTGEFLIKGYASPSVGKFALLVAGYDTADTVNAATYARTKAFDTSKEYKGTSSTSATLVTTEAV